MLPGVEKWTVMGKPLEGSGQQENGQEEQQSAQNHVSFASSESLK